MCGLVGFSVQCWQISPLLPAEGRKILMVLLPSIPNLFWLELSSLLLFPLSARTRMDYKAVPRFGGLIHSTSENGSLSAVEGRFVGRFHLYSLLHLSLAVAANSSDPID